MSHAACALVVAAPIVDRRSWRSLYSAGQPGGARADRLLYQAKLAPLDDELRLKVVRKMYALRFGEEPPNAVPLNSCVALKAHA
ncbi:MAG: hypothetical protein R3B95_02875 [Nitrospirales bacterium]|nr:hypothetical protein [Nitrospirales bacterium]